MSCREKIERWKKKKKKFVQITGKNITIAKKKKKIKANFGSRQMSKSWQLHVGWTRIEKSEVKVDCLEVGF